MKKIATPPDLLAAYASILMSATYYDAVAAAVKADDKNAFRDICRDAGIPNSAVNELWAGALGVQSQGVTMQVPTASGW